MMERPKRQQEQFFDAFKLDEVVPDDHLVRRRARFGRPSIDPVLMIRTPTPFTE